MKSLILFSLIFMMACGKEESGTRRPQVQSPKKVTLKSLCESTYPYHKWIERPVLNKSFKLFTFSLEKFNSEKPSILHIQGGPGITSHIQDSPIRHLKSSHNILSVHIRGGGCSEMPQGEKFDELLSTKHFVEDIKKIQKAYELDAWDMIYGISYGTKPAHLFAHQYPESVKKLYLQSVLPSKELSKNSVLDEVLISNVDQLFSRLQILEELKGVTLKMVKSFYFDIAPQICGEIPGEKCVLQNRLFEHPELTEQVKLLGLRPEFFTSLYYLRYLGTFPTSKLAQKFQQNIALTLVGSTLEFLDREPNQQMKEGFTWMYKRYIESELFVPKKPEVVRTSDLRRNPKLKSFSNRVFKNVYQNDRKDHPDFNFKNFPLSTPTIVISGAQDAVTPYVGAKAYYDEALLGEKKLVKLNGAGHKYIFDRDCEEQFNLSLLNVSENPLSELFGENGICGKDNILEVYENDSY